MKFSCATEPILSELEKDVMKFSCATEPILSEQEKKAFRCATQKFCLALKEDKYGLKANGGPYSDPKD